jgi:hypothetical protein
MTDHELRDTVIAHDATLRQMHGRLGLWVPKTCRNRQPADWCTCHHAARRS